MRITVIGATGGIGTEVARQALAAGHEVVAPVRRPDRMTVSGAGLTVERADVLDTEQLLPLVKGTDAVVSALGQRPGDRAGVVAGGARAAVPAMRAAGVSRLLVVSAEGAFTNPTDGPLVRFVLKPVVARVFRAGFADVREMEWVVRDSGLDWTIVRPPRLTDAPYTGRYRTALDRGLPNGFQICRADVAHAILSAIGNPETVGHVLGVAH